MCCRFIEIWGDNFLFHKSNKNKTLTIFADDNKQKAMRTQTDIISDVYRIVKSASLCNAVNGKVYHDGLRPRDSKKEDIIIRFTTAGEWSQINTAIVTLLIYVPDITRGKTGVRLPDLKRITQVEQAASEFCKHLVGRGDYVIRPKNMIQYSDDLEVEQHFVSVRLSLTWFDEDEAPKPNDKYFNDDYNNDYTWEYPQV